MKTFQAIVKINNDGKLRLDIPVNIPPGEYKVVLVIEESQAPLVKSSLGDFPVHNLGSWNPNLSLRREDV
jgi:hypothetical protein